MSAGSHPAALQVVTWVGAITAVFAAAIAVAQNDIKRIIAYSTISQLGYMMMGLGVGGVAVGMFHLDHARLFQVAPFPRRRLGHSRLPRRTGHPQNGRPEKTHALDFRHLRRRHDGALRRAAVLFRLLEQGRNSARGMELARFHGALLSRRGGRVSDGLLHDTAGKLGVFRKTGRVSKFPCSRA